MPKRIRLLQLGLSKLEMPIQTPRWLPWLSPLTAILGAWFIGVRAIEGGFWSVLFVALVCALLPFIGYRLFVRLKAQYSQNQNPLDPNGLSQGG